MIMTMIVINIHEAKARLSEYVEAAARGERVMICNRNRPVAALVAVEQVRTIPRPVGGTPGVVVAPSFFDPLPDDVLDAFEGETAADTGPSAIKSPRPSRAPATRPVRRAPRARR
jgi:prevent-host-death family protein